MFKFFLHYISNLWFRRYRELKIKDLLEPNFTKFKFKEVVLSNQRSDQQSQKKNSKIAFGELIEIFRKFGFASLIFYHTMIF